MKSSIGYRSDLDGLRAVAVLLVVIFHLKFSWLPGGYIGVDVFFVLSGYLISAIIEKDVAQGDFRFSSFYLRRARRLIPALFATILLTFIGALVILTPIELKQFAGSAIAAAASLSNVLFYFEAGYWDTQSDLKPLLHTWSLGVEEQFYLFWPLFFILLLRLKRRVSMIASLSTVTIIGGAACYWMSSKDASAAFYLSPFRVFQFSAGALCLHLSRLERFQSMLQNRRLTDLLALAALSTLISCGVLYGESVVFPGWAIYPPTIATCLLLLSGAQHANGFFSRTILSNGLSVWIGRVSYSMYLIHWPIIVLYRHGTGMELQLFERCALFGIILVASAALHYGVEKAFYSRSNTARAQQISSNATPFLLRLSGAAALLGVLGVATLSTNGWYKAEANDRFELSPSAIDYGKKMRFFFYDKSCPLTEYWTNPACETQREIQVLVLGNSHEVDGLNFIIGANGIDTRLNLIRFGSMNRCRKSKVVNGEWSPESDVCMERKDMLTDPEFVANLDYVFYASRYPYYNRKDRTLSIFTGLREMNEDIKLITYGPYLVSNQECSAIINKTGDINACGLKDYVRSFGHEVLQPRANSNFVGLATHLEERFGEIEHDYVDRIQLLCHDPNDFESCLTSTPDGIPLMYDHGHMSLAFSLFSGREYSKAHGPLFTEQ